MELAKNANIHPFCVTKAPNKNQHERNIKSTDSWSTCISSLSQSVRLILLVVFVSLILKCGHSFLITLNTLSLNTSNINQSPLRSTPIKKTLNPCNFIYSLAVLKRKIINV